jgi:hypothetical protein
MALIGGEWLALHLSRFTPREGVPNIRYIGGWVGPKISLDEVKKRKIVLVLANHSPKK